MSEVHRATSAACLRWWFHINGPSVGNLAVYMQGVDSVLADLGESDKIWQQGGDHGDVWLYGSVDVNSATDWRQAYNLILLIFV